MSVLSHRIPGHLVTRVRRLQELNRVILDCLPTEMIGHVQIAGLEGMQLTLCTPSPAWAGKLRYCTEDIGRRISTKTGIPVKTVKILIDPKSTTVPRKKRAGLYISKQSAQQFKALADTIDNPSLKRALTRLSGRGD
jgi:hypothetical protein